MDLNQILKNKEILNNLMDLVDIVHDNTNKSIEIEMLILEKAKYKAYFMHKDKLGDILDNQIKENEDHLTGEFDGFSYSSKRANAKFRTLKDMVELNMITKEEYDFLLI